jgi:hypothetical protein
MLKCQTDIVIAKEELHQKIRGKQATRQKKRNDHEHPE